MNVEYIYGSSGSGKTTELVRRFKSTEDASLHDESQDVFGDSIYEMLLVSEASEEANVIIPFFSSSFLISETELKKRNSHQFSFGQIKRIALVRNLLGRRKNKLFDEPFSNIDFEASCNLLSFVSKNEIFLQRTDTFLFTSHRSDFPGFCRGTDIATISKVD